MTTYEQKARVTDNAVAIRIAAEADAEIARLQAQVAESQQQSDALLARGLEYCDKIEALHAQVDALAGALDVAKRTMADYGQCDNDNWPW